VPRASPPSLHRTRIPARRKKEKAGPARRRTVGRKRTVSIATTLRGPVDDVPGRRHVQDARQDGFHHLGFVEKFQHQRQMHAQVQQVVSVHLPLLPNPATPRNTVTPCTLCSSYSGLKMERIRSWLHLVALLDIDAHHGDGFAAHDETPILRDRYAPKIAAAMGGTTDAVM
jgi:hypothetical protein